MKTPKSGILVLPTLVRAGTLARAFGYTPRTNWKHAFFTDEFNHLSIRANNATMAAITLIMAAAKMTIAARFERLLSLVVGGTWSGFLAIRHRATPAKASRRAPSSAII